MHLAWPPDVHICVQKSGSGKLLFHRPFLLGAFLVFLAAILFAGLRPFQFLPENGARPDGDGGLAFTPPAQAWALLPPLDLAGGMVLRVRAAPLPGPARTMDRMVSVLDGHGDEVLTISQSGEGAWVSGSAFHSSPRLGGWFGKAFPRGKPSLLTLTSGPEGTTLSRDGIPLKTYPDLRPSFPSSPASLLLGNSPDGRSPWGGAIRSVSLQGSVATLGFSSTRPALDFTVPKVFRPLAPQILEGKLRRIISTPSGARDAALNLLGFLPFGFLLCLLLPRKRGTLILAVMAGFSLSLGIELLQVLLPGRTSSLSDLALNTAGAMLGALWAEKRASSLSDLTPSRQ